MSVKRKSLVGWTAKNWYEAKGDFRLRFGWKDWLSVNFRHKQKIAEIPEIYKYGRVTTPRWNYPVKVRITIEEVK
jgi:hypothetical protein